MTNIVDLDALVPVDKQVTFGQRVWELPGDMPMELFVKLQMLTEKADDEEDASSEKQIFDELVAIMIELFTYKVPDEDTDSRDFLGQRFRQLGIKMFMQLWRHIYGDEVDTEPDPTEPQVTSSPDEVPPGPTTTSPPTPEPTPSPESPAPTEPPTPPETAS